MVGAKDMGQFMWDTLAQDRRLIVRPDQHYRKVEGLVVICPIGDAHGTADLFALVAGGCDPTAR